MPSKTDNPQTVRCIVKLARTSNQQSESSSDAWILQAQRVSCSLPDHSHFKHLQLSAVQKGEQESIKCTVTE